MNSLRVRAIAVTLSLLGIIVLLFPFVEFSGPNRGHLNFYSMTEEQRLGEQAALNIEARFKPIRTPQLTTYLQRLGMSIVSVTEPSEITYRFRLVDTPMVNAITLPGGHIYVTSGLILSVQSEGELAGVLAHEIGHAVSRHGTEHLSRTIFLGFINSIGGALLGGGGAPGLVANLEGLSYSRGDETHADDLAVDFMYQAGYHPEAMARFFDRLLLLHQEAQLTAFLSTHPLSQDRAERVRWRISDWPLDDRWRRDAPAFHEAQALLRTSKGFKADKKE